MKSTSISRNKPLASESVEEFTGRLTKYDYDFLQGRSNGGWSTAMSIVYSFCRKHGLGGFGDPTDRGRTAMKRYEKEQERSAE